jgi:4-hydroxybenzoate polyprenyltransferase
MKASNDFEKSIADQRGRSFFRKLLNLLELIKFSHTIFALPFALISMMVAAGGFPDRAIFGWIVVCMIGARTAAMGFNRYLDWELDQQNPRTQIRSALATKGGAMILTLIGAAFFLFAVTQLNSLCLALAPLALLVVLGYSWLKRFSVWCHLGLGFALSAAPMGAWAAVRGDFYSWEPWLLAFAVLWWVFGFDLIYATQDAEFDRQAGLYSIPARFGVLRSLFMARAAHGLTFISLGVFGVVSRLGFTYWMAYGVVAAALIYEHHLSRDPSDLGKLNRAFFLVNGVIGIVLFAGVAWSLI